MMSQNGIPSQYGPSDFFQKKKKKETRKDNKILLEYYIYCNTMPSFNFTRKSLFCLVTKILDKI